MTTDAAMATVEHPVVLFDGVCNLCDATVNFLIDHDPGDVLRFTALQSEPGRALLAARGVTAPEGDPDSILLVEGDRVWTHSDAALRIAARLPAPWRWARAFLIVPRFARDAVYRFIARNRYRWFGRTEMCRMPTPALRARFLK